MSAQISSNFQSPLNHGDLVESGGGDRAERWRRERLRMFRLVAGGVHDRLVPPDLRGPDVPPADKAAALGREVDAWSQRLVATGVPELERLARRVARCPTYASGLLRGLGPSEAWDEDASGCGAATCPACYARKLDEQLRWLEMSPAPELLVASHEDRVVSFGFAGGDRESATRAARPLREQVSAMRALLRQQQWEAVTRLDLLPRPGPGGFTFGCVKYAVMPWARQSLPTYGVQLAHGPYGHRQLFTYGRDEAGVAAVADVFAYPAWVFEEAYEEALPCFLASLGRARVLARV